MNAFAGRSDCQRAGRGGAETDKTIDPSPPALRLYRSDGNFTCCADPAVRLSDTGWGGAGGAGRARAEGGVGGAGRGPGLEGTEVKDVSLSGEGQGADAGAGKGKDHGVRE